MVRRDTPADGGPALRHARTDRGPARARGRARGDPAPEAGGRLVTDPDCLLYLVSRAADDPDSVWVAEAWTDRGAHDASLEDPGARELIGRARPIIASFADRAELRPEGGKGLDD